MQDHAVHKKITDVRRLADMYGIELPPSLVSVLDADTVPMPNPADVEREAVAAIGAATGTRNIEKVRDAALGRIAAAHASTRIHAQVRRAETRAKWQAVREHADEIVSALRAATTEDFATLTRCAPLVPLTATADTTGLSKAAYAARFDGSQAASRLEDVAGLVAAIRGLSAVHKDARTLLVRIPDTLSGDDALAMSLGFAGSRYGVGSGGYGIVQNPALWWVAVAAAGGEFALVDAAEARRTKERMAAARSVGTDRPESERRGLVL